MSQVNTAHLTLLLSAIGKQRQSSALLQFLGETSSYSILITRWKRGQNLPDIGQITRIAEFASTIFKSFQADWLELWLYGRAESTDIDTILGKIIKPGKLREFRESLGLNQTKCAESLKISRATLIIKEKTDDAKTLELARIAYPQIASSQEKGPIASDRSDRGQEVF